MAENLLLEIGAEEIPASFVAPALEELARAVVDGLREARLGHGEVKTYGTPRRLAVCVAGVVEASSDLTRDVLGPPVRVAFDKDGKPTHAALKFAAGLGVGPEKLDRRATPKGEYLAARVHERGRPALGLLPGVLGAAVHSLHFKKSMRWGDVEQAFARPVHWIVALFGAEVVPVTFGDVQSGRTTRGHRFLSPTPVEVPRASDYLELLRERHVIADVSERRALVLSRARAAAKAAGGALLEDASLLDQVTQLVEFPNPVAGAFEASYLDLPPEVLVSELKNHQRYFAVVDGQGRLFPKFVAVSNTPVRDEALSRRGYERVLRARLADGRFFFDEDRKTPLVDRVPKLARVVFQQSLGSYAEKVDRFRALAVFLANEAGLGHHQQTIEAAATLAKADLVTGMVGEFPELQGVMGREYAKASGEPPEVALAIYEHYLPRSAQDALPTADPGALVGMADRMDTLCGIFAIGKSPTGAADPFGLRRACLAIVHLVLGKGYRLSLSRAVGRALELLAPKLGQLPKKPDLLQVKAEVLDFFRGRLKALWGEAHRVDVVEAVLSAGFDDLVAARKRLESLSAIVGRADFVPLAVAFKRVVNIVEKQGKDVAKGPVSLAKLVDDAEIRLHASVTAAREKVARAVQADDYPGALREITSLKPEVDLFFDKVMVMAEDRELRENRIRFLCDIGALFGQVADFAKIQAEVS